MTIGNLYLPRSLAGPRSGGIVNAATATAIEHVYALRTARAQCASRLRSRRSCCRRGVRPTPVGVNNRNNIHVPRAEVVSRNRRQSRRKTCRNHERPGRQECAVARHGRGNRVGAGRAAAGPVLHRVFVGECNDASRFRAKSCSPERQPRLRARGTDKKKKRRKEIFDPERLSVGERGLSRGARYCRSRNFGKISM